MPQIILNAEDRFKDKGDSTHPILLICFVGHSV